MSKIDTVYIHHPGINAEAQVPPSQVASHVAFGWIEGPDEARQAERDEEAERRALHLVAIQTAFAAEQAELAAQAEREGAAFSAAGFDVKATVPREHREPHETPDLLEGPLPDQPAKNATAEAWIAYARSVGITVADNAHRSDVQALIEQAHKIAGDLADATPNGDNDHNPHEEGLQ